MRTGERGGGGGGRGGGRGGGGLRMRGSTTQTVTLTKKQALKQQSASLSQVLLIKNN